VKLKLFFDKIETIETIIRHGFAAELLLFLLVYHFVQVHED